MKKSSQSERGKMEQKSCMKNGKVGEKLMSSKERKMIIYSFTDNFN